MTVHLSLQVDDHPDLPGRDVVLCADGAMVAHFQADAETATELAARIDAGEIDGGAVTWEIASHVLAHYGEPGMKAGSFTRALIAALAAADWPNRLKLAAVYPGYVLAVTWARDHTDGIARLKEIAVPGTGPASKLPPVRSAKDLLGEA